MLANTSDIITQLEKVRDGMIAAATQEADDWFAAAVAPLKGPPQNLAVQELANTNGPKINAADSLIDKVRTVVHWFGDRDNGFTTRDVGHVIAPFFPLDSAGSRSTLSAVVRQLAIDNEIDLVRVGKGSKPSLYQKKQRE